MHVLASISTKGRYDSSLPLAMQAVAMQDRVPDKLVIFDDNNPAKDLRENPLYRSLFLLFDERGIKWEVVYGRKKGQHHNHQIAQEMANELVWRVDDDCLPEPDCLGKLLKCFDDNVRVGAVGGLILINPAHSYTVNPSQLYNRVDQLAICHNIQWFKLLDIHSNKRCTRPIEVDHLHCSFLYRKAVANYNLDLSPVAHTEETQFTYEIKRAGYKLFVVPDAVSHHLKIPTGGIRSQEYGVHYFKADEDNFNRKLVEWGVKQGEPTALIYLDNGLGDHLCFRLILPELRAKFKKFIIFACYPEVFEDDKDVELRSIAEAHNIIFDKDRYNVYKYMIDHPGTNLQQAFRKIYL